jgi:hypothetical protein
MTKNFKKTSIVNILLTKHPIFVNQIFEPDE